MSDPRRPLVTKDPVVGTVTLARIFKRVLFPAPFMPMSPSTSPRFNEKVTSRSAQNSSRGSTLWPRRRAVRRPTSSLSDVTYQPRRSRYRLETPESSMVVSDMVARVLSDHVRESTGGALEHRERDANDDCGDSNAHTQGRQVRGGAQDERAPVAVDDGRHGIEQIEGPEPRRDDADRVGNGRGEHPELDDEREGVPHVAKVD